MIRYFYAIIWACLLATFSYGELVCNFFLNNFVSFEQELTKLSNSKLAVYSNIGLVLMLHFDNFITRKITKDNTPRLSMGLWLSGSIVALLLLAVLANKVIEEEQKLYNWFHLYYLFIIYFVCLIVYKAKALNIKRNLLDID